MRSKTFKSASICTVTAIPSKFIREEYLTVGAYKAGLKKFHCPRTVNVNGCFSKSALLPHLFYWTYEGIEYQARTILIQPKE